MTKARVIETNEGIQGEFSVLEYNEFAKSMRDKGYNNVDTFIKAGLCGGNVLEIGPGPGYVGLEWLKKTNNDKLTGLEISENMIKMALKNANDYGFQDKVNYIKGSCMDIPFEDNTFDAVFSNGSLHEWEDPVQSFNEIFRVLKNGGMFCVADLRRDCNKFIKWISYYSTKQKSIRPRFLTSLYAAYTKDELTKLFTASSFSQFKIDAEPFGLFAKCIK